MGKVDVEYKTSGGVVCKRIYKISKLRLASSYFRIQGAKSCMSQIFTSLGKAIIIFHLLENESGKFKRSAELRDTDPTEKGTYSYYLGMAACKWFSEKMFKIPHLQYFSLARPHYT